MSKVYDFEANDFIEVPLNENRAFLYGDGFFETIKVVDKNPLNIDYHYSRIVKGLNAFNFDKIFNLSELKTSVELFLEKQPENGRLKLVIFRSNGGLYEPVSSKPLVYFELKSIDIHSTRAPLKSAIISEDVKNYPSPLSFVKPISASNYIIAGLEKKEKNAEEMILLDNSDNVSECLYSNIWWIKNNSIFTPSLETNCVEGTSRMRLMEFLSKNNIDVQMVQNKIESLLEADFCFASNSFGLSILNKINNYEFSNEHPLFDKIKAELF